MSHTLSVHLGLRSYPIHFGNLSRLAAYLKPLAKTGRIFVITNPTILRFHGPRVRKILSPLDPTFLTVPDGERYKTFDTAYRLHSQLIKAHADRHSIVVALGGGVIGDLAGFVAATYMRGISLVMVPTTLLAMADSAIGGKVAVNHPWAKNVIGAFHQPKFVFVDFDFLRTLSECEFLCGLAEVAKYGLAVDRSFFTWLRKNMPGLLDRGQVVEEAIRQSCRLKARIVAQDEKDTGKRMILNFGHTFGHALECVGEYKAIKHGEAVWLGMLAASHMSFQTGLMDDDDFEEILMTLRPPLHRIGANPRVRKFVQSWSLRGAVKQMNSDKKSRRGLRHVVLLRGIGKAAVFQWSDDAQLQRSLEWMKAMVDKRTSHE